MKKKKIIAVMMSLAVAATSALGVSSSLGVSEAKAETSRVDKIMEGMTLDQKIGQMIMPDFRQWQQEGETSVTDLTVMNDEVAEIIDKYDFGGVILFANNVKGTEQTLKLTEDMQKAAVSNAAGNGDLPLLLTIDQEGGIVYRLGSGTALPGNMALGATRSLQAANDVGEVIGRELDALGINVNFAPAMDTNNNPNNPVIGLRSISSDPHLVAELGVPMMKGMQKHNVATAAKHFPGHGDTATDSHTGLPLVDKSYEELKEMELIPFQAAIDNGVDLIMTAHIQFPQIEKDTVISKADGREVYVPATLSDDIITGLLREKMNFEGVVVTDAMNMSAISSNFGEAQAVIMAIQAGVDICLMPTTLRSTADIPKLDAIFTEVKNALADGTITEDQLDDSVERILTLKEERGILDYASDTRTWDEKLANALEQVGSEQNRAIEREVAAQAVTVIRNEDDALPYRAPENAKIVLISAWPNEQPGMELGVRRLINDGVLPESTQYESMNYCIWEGYGGSSLATIKSKIDEADYVVVVSEIEGASTMNTNADGDWEAYYPNEIIKYANSKQVPATLMSISKPYDAVIYPEARSMVAIYGYIGMDPTEEIDPERAFGANIPAGIEVIFGGHGATGKLPVDLYAYADGGFTDEIVYPIGHGITYDAINAEKVSTAVLEQALILADSVDTEGVIASVAARFNEAKAHAEEVIAQAQAGYEMISQEIIDQSWMDLIKIMQYLSFKQGDKEDLRKVIEMAETLDKDRYLSEGWETFEGALTAAQKVLDDGDAMQTDVNNAWKALLEAMSDLRLKPNKEALEALVLSAESMSLDNVAAEDVVIFRVALAEAKAVYADDEATAEEVADAVDTLTAAVDKINASSAGKVEDQIANTAGNTDTSADRIKEEDANTSDTAKDSHSAKADSTTNVEKSAKTGDMSNTVAMAVAMLAAAMAGIAVYVKNREER